MAYFNWSAFSSPTNSEESGYGSPAEVRNGKPFSPFQGLSQSDLASYQEHCINSREWVQKNLFLDKEQEHISIEDKTICFPRPDTKQIEKAINKKEHDKYSLSPTPGTTKAKRVFAIKKEIACEDESEQLFLPTSSTNSKAIFDIKKKKKSGFKKKFSPVCTLTINPESIKNEKASKDGSTSLDVTSKSKMIVKIKKEPKECEHHLNEDVCSMSSTKPETNVAIKKEKESHGFSDQTFFPRSQTKQKVNVKVIKKKEHKHGINQAFLTESKGQSKAHVFLKKEKEHSRSLSPTLLRTFSTQSRASVTVKTEEKEKDLRPFHTFDQLLPQLHDYKQSDSKKVIADPSSSTSTPDGRAKVSLSPDIKKDEERRSTGMWSRRYHPYYGHIRAATTSGIQRTLEPLESRHHKRIGDTLQHAPYIGRKLTHTPLMFRHTVSVHDPSHDPVIKVQNSPDTLPCRESTIQAKPQEHLYQHSDSRDKNVPNAGIKDVFPRTETPISPFVRPSQDSITHSGRLDHFLPLYSEKPLTTKPENTDYTGKAKLSNPNPTRSSKHAPYIHTARRFTSSDGAAHTLQEKEAHSGPSARKSERFSKATPKKESVAGLKYNTSHTKEGTPTSQGVKVRAPKTQPRCTTSLTKDKLPKQRTASATSTASELTMNKTSGDSADTSDTNNAISPPQDPFATLKISPDARKLENLLKMQDIADDLKTVLRPELYRPDAPWKDSSLLMGLDKDLTFKVWVQKEFQGAISNTIKETLHKERKTEAPEYLTKLKVIGLKEAFKLQRDAAISLLPGQKLYIKSNVSTTHMDNLTGDEVYYETGNKKISLGKIVSHISTGEPFREACLIEIHKEELKNVSEYITENPPRFISDIYGGELKHIPYIREQALMSSEPGCFNAIACKGVFDYMDGRTILKDAILWTSDGNAGGPGKSGSGIFALSENDVELVAMYIGRGRGAHKGCLISHGMKATIDFFSEQIGHTLQVFNVNTKPDVVEAANAASSAHTSNTSCVLQDSNTAYASAEHSEHSDVPQPSLHASALVYAFQVGDGAPNAQISTAGSMSEVSDEEYAPQFINGLAVLQDGAATNSDANVEEGLVDHENQSPNSYLRVISAREPLSRDARGGKIAKKRIAAVKVMNTENGQRSFLKKARVESRTEQADPNNRSIVFIGD